MSYIQNNVMFKCSKHKNKILAAYNNPINRELVKQIDDSYLDNSDLGEEVEVDEVVEDKGGSPTTSKSPRKSSSGGYSGSGGGFSGSGSVDFDDDFEGDFDSDIPEASDVDVDIDTEDVEVNDNVDTEVEESTKVTNQPIQSNTYVTVESVSNAVNILPGTLNMKEETKGASQAILRGGKDNQVWIYYDPEIKLTNILESVNNTLIEQNMYFLEFDRVSRDDNAIVYNINWVSNYFNPLQLNNNE